MGPALHQLARGIDDRPVAENGPAKQISAESTFPEDLTTLDQLREAVASIGDHAHTRLVKDGRGARTVTVKLKKSDMSTLTRSATLPYATTDATTLITCLALAPDAGAGMGQSQLLAGGADGSLTLWDTLNAAPLVHMKDPGNSVYSVAFAPGSSGRIFAAAGRDARVAAALHG